MTNEHEMRVSRDGRPATEDEVRRALAVFDPAASVRLVADTGILHVGSRRDTLDIVEALAKAGLEAGAATG